MSDDPVIRTEGSSAVQGCLLGAVILFVVLLGAMIFLAYRQFREHTDEPSAPAVAFQAALYRPNGSLAGRDPSSLPWVA